MFVATSVHSTMGKGAARWWRALWLAWVVVAWAAQPSQAQRLIWLGTLPGGYGSVARGVSADGSVVVGSARNAAELLRAFRWTTSGGIQDLGTLGGDSSWALGVSADGSVVVGSAQNAAGRWRAFRWTAAGGMEDLNTTYASLLTDGSVLGEAYAISSDGRYIVGLGYNVATGLLEAFLLDTQGTGVEERLIWLGTLGGSWSEAHGVSDDGSVVVGRALNAAGQGRAFRWTAGRGMQDLGTLGGNGSDANGVSADGSVVVGSAQNAAGQGRAFRWTAAGGMQDLGTLGGDWSWADAVSADGSVVVGAADNAARQRRAFRWTAAGGMEDLNTTYASLLTDGSVLIEASAISPDGRYIVGYGMNATAWRFEAYLLDTQGTGVEERSGAARVWLRLLPQLVHERVVLELEAAEAAGRVTIVVSDVLGRVVAELLRGAVLPPGVQQRIELDVRAWAAGQYTVVLRTEAGSTAVPLVVVR
jgi:probable HAF family extracellular repeat protein